MILNLGKKHLNPHVLEKLIGQHIEEHNLLYSIYANIGQSPSSNFNIQLSQFWRVPFSFVAERTLIYNLKGDLITKITEKPNNSPIIKRYS